MTEKKKHCRICNGRRGETELGRNVVCEGCATPVANCHITDVQLSRTKTRLVCPMCRGTRADHIELGRFCCTTCGTQYELLEQEFLDDRPDVNLEKKEAHAAANVKRILRHG